MKEIHRPDIYQPAVPSSSNRAPYAVYVFVAIVIAASAFSVGFRASEKNWLQADSKDQANQSLPDDLSYESVEEVYDSLRANFDGQLSEELLLDGLKKGLAEASGDAYTVYFNPTESAQFYSDLNGSFEGIGAELGVDGDVIIVVSPIRGFPAEEAGLRPQDSIIEIDGEDAIGISVEEAVSKIRGEAGTDVVLTIVRDGERLEITITRAKITLPSVEYEYLNDGKIGYLQITRFAEDTSDLARAAALEFKANNVEGVILDVRSNSGGFVDAAIEVASLWLDEEVVFEQRSGGASEGTLNAKGNPLLNGVQTIVLINQGSASASEIVAGALKDHDAATIVGATSFGKGSVQQLDQLDDGSTLKVTIARWFTPAGVNIDDDGIAPDVDVEFTEADFENETDSQLDKALELLSN